MMKRYVIGILLLSLTLSSCTWLRILDTNPYDDKDPTFDAWLQEKVVKANDQVLGKTKDQTAQLLAKPDEIRKLSGQYWPDCVYRVFKDGRLCDSRECGHVTYDEVWLYSVERRHGTYYSSAGYTVFFSGDRVVSVDGGMCPIDEPF